MKTQRSRAQQRARHDRRGRGDDVDPREELGRRIATIGEALEGAGSLAQLDLQGFLQRTGDLEVPPAERLRQLAITVEWVAVCAPQPEGWSALDRVYAAALRLDPECVAAWHSRGISAVECADSSSIDPQTQRRILGSGRRALETAHALSPEDRDVSYAMGQLVYRDPQCSAEDALVWFRRALASAGPSEGGWAQLYVAHCLHDLGRFGEALEAYGRLKEERFAGRPAWRYALALEQRAECLLGAGREGEALAAFEAILSRYESLETLHTALLARYVVDAARGKLREALFERVLALAQTHARSWTLERLESA